MDRFVHQVLVALDTQDGASASDLLDQLLRSEDRVPMVMYSDRTIEQVLRDSAHLGLVEELDSVAQYHAPDRPSPVAVRRFCLTDAGRVATAEVNIE